MDKNWRPANWNSIKHNIVQETPLIFSPSHGYSKDQSDQIIEKTAMAILEALDKEGELANAGAKAGAGSAESTSAIGTNPKGDTKPTKS